MRAAFGESDVIAVEDLPEGRENVFAPTPALPTPLAPRVFNEEIDRSWRISSFSSLISGRMEDPETPDYDRMEPGVESVEEPVLPTQGIHAFPGGMRAGTCLHLILEELDFADLSQLRPLVARKLGDFHFDTFVEGVCDILARTLRVPLGEDGFMLSSCRWQSIACSLRRPTDS
ncbi:MAG: hypothetical protein DMF23_01280 [Verrucomicrobia bacterium]|nr:MAG: hypothetical protein DMF23_01280 [Verrucomicrobiota bacterium]